MSRYTDAKCRLCRREQEKLFLKGAKCSSEKCAMEKKRLHPGKDAKGQTKPLIGYNQQLRQKQKVKRHYGMTEKQFYLFFQKANKMTGVTSDNLVQMLERRLDNVVYKAGFACSRDQARQMVSHGLVHVNGHKVDIPSYLVKKEDKLTFKKKNLESETFKDQINVSKSLANSRDRIVPGWIEVNYDNFEAKVLEYPSIKDVYLTVEPRLIVELYSK